MRETIDNTTNLEVDPAVAHVFVKVVFIYEFLWNVADIDADIFGAVQWSLEVNVSGVKGDVFGSLA